MAQVSNFKILVLFKLMANMPKDHAKTKWQSYYKKLQSYKLL